MCFWVCLGVCVYVSFLINLCYRIQCNKLYFGINIRSHYSIFPLTSSCPHAWPLSSSDCSHFFSQIAIPSFSISQSIPWPLFFCQAFPFFSWPFLVSGQKEKKKREGAGWWWVYILNFYSVDDRKCAVVFLFLYVWHILLNIMISSSIYCKCQIVIPLYGWIKCGVHIQHFKKICSLILDI